MKRIVPTLSALLVVTGAVDADDDAIGYPSVAGALQALQSDSTAQFESQQGWTIVASRDGDKPVQWFFTPEGHAAHPAVIKRTVLEQDGTGFIDLAALCHAAQGECDALLDDFRQSSEGVARSLLAQQVTLDIGIALNDHERVRITRLLTEEGKAAEIRMDEQLKLVIVPTLDDALGVLLWTAIYEFDGGEYILLSEPRFATPREGTARIEVSSGSGNTFGLSITPLLAAR